MPRSFLTVPRAGDLRGSVCWPVALRRVSQSTVQPPALGRCGCSVPLGALVPVKGAAPALVPGGSSGLGRLGGVRQPLGLGTADSEVMQVWARAGPVR